jgi:hypothetical protein
MMEYNSLPAFNEFLESPDILDTQRIYANDYYEKAANPTPGLATLVTDIYGYVDKDTTIKRKVLHCAGNDAAMTMVALLVKISKLLKGI